MDSLIETKKYRFQSYEMVNPKRTDEMKKKKNRSSCYVTIIIETIHVM